MTLDNVKNLKCGF